MGEAALLRLTAEDGEDLATLSAVVQDSLAAQDDMVYDRRDRSFTISLCRFCHECEQPRRMPSALQIGSVLSVKSRGLEAMEPSVPLVMLAIEAVASKDSEIELTLVFAGESRPEIRIRIECLDLILMDMGDAYPARACPQHIS